MSSYDSLNKKSSSIFEKHFQCHPFLNIETIDQAQIVLGEFYGVSEYFPYIQSIACAEQIEATLNSCRPLPLDIGLTSVVGSFLTWDELGGHHVISQGGQAALPNIINSKNFHAYLFKKDMELIFGPDYQPQFSSATVNYLNELKQGLGAVDTCERVAHMVAFEMHAESMLSALYSTLKTVKPIPPKGLVFFEIHIGDNDPAEAYHVEMTNRLINALITPENEIHFLKYFSDACNLHHKWCLQVMES